MKNKTDCGTIIFNYLMHSHTMPITETTRQIDLMIGKIKNLKDSDEKNREIKKIEGLIINICNK